MAPNSSQTRWWYLLLVVSSVFILGVVMARVLTAQDMSAPAAEARALVSGEGAPDASKVYLPAVSDDALLLPPGPASNTFTATRTSSATTTPTDTPVPSSTPTAIVNPIPPACTQLATATLTVTTTPGVPTPPPGFALMWGDDFAGAAGSPPSAANWCYDLGTSYPGGPANWGTGEVETDTSAAANAQLDGNDHLLITPLETNGAWTSARLETQRADFAAPSGGQLMVSASIEQPNPADGLGYWPAFWMLGAAYRGNYWNWPSVGEIDIMEDVNALGEHAGTLHCGTDTGGPCDEPNGLSSGLQACPACQTGYHTYSVIVDRTDPAAEQLRWYLDGTEYYCVSEAQPVSGCRGPVDVATWQAAMDHGFFLILDVAIGGAFPDAVCGCTAPSGATSPGAPMGVAYVVVYQSTGPVPTPTACAPTCTPTPTATATITPSPALTATPPGGTGTPTIEFTSVPPYGSSGVPLQGQEQHVAPTDAYVAVYIDVGGGWWIKPYADSPQTILAPDGSWSCNITTGGNDQDATDIVAYLLPNSYSAPIVLGSSSLPSDLDANMLAKVETTRSPPTSSPPYFG